MYVLHASVCVRVHTCARTCARTHIFFPPSSLLIHKNSNTQTFYWEFLSHSTLFQDLELALFSIVFLVSSHNNIYFTFSFPFVSLQDFYSDKHSSGCCRKYVLFLGKSQKKWLFLLTFLLSLDSEKKLKQNTKNELG